MSPTAKIFMRYVIEKLGGLQLNFRIAKRKFTANKLMIFMARSITRDKCPESF